MFDSYNRRIHYLRISVTDRCNLRCVYCMPERGIKKISRDEILTFEEIARIAEKSVGMGIDKIRLTGGEPLVRRDIVNLVSMISGIEGIIDFSMTTNGTLLMRFAKELKEAGLHRVNISLDTLDPVYYREITRGGNLHDVLKGIESAEKAGLTPIKLNCVVRESSDENNARQVANFAKKRGLEVRYIRCMNMEEGLFWHVEGGTGGDCGICNRLRLSSDGKIYPCLFGEKYFCVRTLDIEEALKKAVEEKPETGFRSVHKSLITIGG